MGLKLLTRLSLVDCSLIDIDGIGVLNSLIFLNLNDNCITEVGALAMHDTLEVSMLVLALCDLCVLRTVTVFPLVCSIFMCVLFVWFLLLYIYDIIYHCFIGAIPIWQQNYGHGCG